MLGVLGKCRFVSHYVVPGGYFARRSFHQGLSGANRPARLMAEIASVRAHGLEEGGRFRSTDRFLKDDTGAHFADGSGSSLREPAVVALESPDTTNPYVLKARHPVQP